MYLKNRILVVFFILSLVFGVYTPNSNAVGTETGNYKYESFISALSFQWEVTHTKNGLVIPPGDYMDAELNYKTGDLLDMQVIMDPSSAVMNASKTFSDLEKYFTMMVNGVPATAGNFSIFDILIDEYYTELSNGSYVPYLDYLMQHAYPHPSGSYPFIDQNGYYHIDINTNSTGNPVTTGFLVYDHKGVMVEYNTTNIYSNGTVYSGAIKNMLGAQPPTGGPGGPPGTSGSSFWRYPHALPCDSYMWSFSSNAPSAVPGEITITIVDQMMMTAILMNDTTDPATLQTAFQIDMIANGTPAPVQYDAFFIMQHLVPIEYTLDGLTHGNYFDYVMLTGSSFFDFGNNTKLTGNVFTVTDVNIDPSTGATETRVFNYDFNDGVLLNFTRDTVYTNGTFYSETENLVPGCNNPGSGGGSGGPPSRNYSVAKLSTNLKVGEEYIWDFTYKLNGVFSNGSDFDNGTVIKMKILKDLSTLEIRNTTTINDLKAYFSLTFGPAGGPFVDFPIQDPDALFFMVPLTVTWDNGTTVTNYLQWLSDNKLPLSDIGVGQVANGVYSVNETNMNGFETQTREFKFNATNGVLMTFQNHMDYMNNTSTVELMQLRAGSPFTSTTNTNTTTTPISTGTTNSTTSVANNTSATNNTSPAGPTPVNPLPVSPLFYFGLVAMAVIYRKRR